MNNTLKQFTLVRDALLESMPNGDPQIYWSDPVTWGNLQGAAGIRLIATLFQATTNTTAQIIAQWGVDGKSWTDFVESLDGQPATPVSLSAEATQFAYQYTGLPEEFSGLVRVGVMVARSVSTQARIRLSADILPLTAVAANTLTIAEDAVVSSTGTPDTVGKVIVSNAYDRGTVYARTLGAYTAGDTTLFVQTSMYNSTTYSGTWRTIATLASVFTATGQERAIAFTGADRYLRVVGVRSVAGDSILDVDVFVRPEV